MLFIKSFWIGSVAPCLLPPSLPPSFCPSFLSLFFFLFSHLVRQQLFLDEDSDREAERPGEGGGARAAREGPGWGGRAAQGGGGGEEEEEPGHREGAQLQQPLQPRRGEAPADVRCCRRVSCRAVHPPSQRWMGGLHDDGRYKPRKPEIKERQVSGRSCVREEREK